jgi:hypothetical protein
LVRGADRIDPPRDHEVVGIDWGEFDPGEDLVRAGGVGLGDVDEFETVDGVAKSGEMNGSHIRVSFDEKAACAWAGGGICGQRLEVDGLHRSCLD